MIASPSPTISSQCNIESWNLRYAILETDTIRNKKKKKEYRIVSENPSKFQRKTRSLTPANAISRKEKLLQMQLLTCSRLIGISQNRWRNGTGDGHANGDVRTSKSSHSRAVPIRPLRWVLHTACAAEETGRIAEARSPRRDRTALNKKEAEVL